MVPQLHTVKCQFVLVKRNLIKIRSLTCYLYLICRSAGEICGNHITGHMQKTLCSIQWKWWLLYLMKLLLSCLACYEQNDWWKKVILVFIISLYSHDIRSLACNPYWSFLMSPSPWDIKIEEQVRDLILIRLSHKKQWV